MALRKMPENIRSWFEGELTYWREAEIVPREQIERIACLYESPAAVHAQKSAWLIFILMGMASLMMVLAVLLLVGYNWEAMPPALKLGVLFAGLFGLHGFGFYLRFKRAKTFLSEIFFFSGCLMYGVCIWQVAQIFNIHSHYPNGIWIWAVGVLPFALCMETPLLHLLFVVLIGIWAGVEVLDFPGFRPWLFFRWFSLPNGAYSLPLLALPGMIWAYRKKSALTLWLYVPLLTWWIFLQPLAWDFRSSLYVYFIGAFGGLLMLIGQLHGKKLAFAMPYRLFGVLIAAVPLILLSFYDFNREMLYWHSHSYLYYYGDGMNNLEMQLWRHLIASAILVIFGGGLIYASARGKRESAGNSLPIGERMYALVRREWLPAGLIAAMIFMPVIELSLLGLGNNTFAILPTLFGNIGVLVMALWLLSTGLHSERGLPFAGGVTLFLLWTIFRYIDLFADFGGMLGAALMFFLCGAGLLGAALYWRQRKAVRHA